MIEIDRQLFMSLNYDKATRMYYVLLDGNYETKFYAPSDEKAKVKFREYLLAKRIIIMEQDFVPTRETTVGDVMKDIEENPLDVIQYLLELLEQ